MSHHSSAESEKQPYMRIQFWLKNRFWDRGHSQKSRDYFNKWLSDWVEREKSTHKFSPDIQKHGR